MQNITDVLEELTIEKESEFKYLINQTDFTDKAKTLIQFLHNRIIDLERKEKKTKSLQDQKCSVLAKSHFTPKYTTINQNYKKTNRQQDNGKTFITGMSLAEQKAQEFNRKKY